MYKGDDAFTQITIYYIYIYITHRGIKDNDQDKYIQKYKEKDKNNPVCQKAPLAAAQRGVKGLAAHKAICIQPWKLWIPI